MPVLVTAFGPFGGRSENASSLALHELRKTIPNIRTRILPVDAVVAPSRLRQAIKLIRPSAVIMLGETGQTKEILLERTAWNSKDFSIPDIAGRSYQELPIRRMARDSLPSTLPLEEIRQALLMKQLPVGYSENPGRYLCNQLFFCAMDFLETEGFEVPAGFIHLPLETDLPTEKAAAGIREAIRILQD